MATEIHPHNVAIAEVNHGGQIGHVKAAAATANDDAIQLIINMMAQIGIADNEVLKLYSIREPSPHWCAYFAKHWPKAEITYSFRPGEDARMESEIAAFIAKRDKG